MNLARLPMFTVTPLRSRPAVTPLAAFASLVLAGSAYAAPQTATKLNSGPDPRTPLTATTTPGDADSTFRITKPGSYYLPRNLAGQAGKAGIEIAASNVRLDLMGFRLSGGAGTLDGIVVTTPGALTVVVENANVYAWGGDGIDLSNVSAGGVVRTSSATGNAGVGVRLGDDAEVESSTCAGNGVAGVLAGDAARLKRVRAKLNVVGIETGMHAELVECSATNNTGDGVRTRDRSRLVDCSARTNGGYGYWAYNGSNYLRCDAIDNTRAGIQTVNRGGLVDSCYLAGNATGVALTGSGTVRDCEVSSNTYGISTGGGLVERNHITGGTIGVVASSGARIVENQIRGCSSDGISITVGRSHVEANTVSECGVIGIRLSGIDSSLLRNVASNNPIDYYVPAGNKAGPIVSTDGFAPTTDPWANFSS